MQKDNFREGSETGMLDQAHALREAVKESASTENNFDHQPVAVAITSGKGGVGKTNVAANLAVALAKMGQRVLVLDADFGMANIDVLLGLAPQYNLGDYLFGKKSLEEILIEGPEGIRIIPASSGIEQMAALTPGQQSRLMQGVARLGESTDYLLIDTAAGISGNVINFLQAAGIVIVVTAPEPTAIVDAYLMVKILAHRDPGKKVYVLVNSVSGRDEANSVFRQIDQAARRFLNKSVDLFGYIERDKNVLEAVRFQMPIVSMLPTAPASKCLNNLARKLHKECNQKRQQEKMTLSWDALFDPSNPWKE
jgi:flagellar biosynthesis protein FlhG